MRRALLGAAVAAACALAAGCGDGGDTKSDSANGAPARSEAGGTLVVAQGVEPRTLNPWTSVVMEMNVTWQLYERLLAFDPASSEFVPTAAKGWKWVDDTTLDVELKPGNAFTNGEPVDAAAAVFSLEQLVDPKIGATELPDAIANLKSFKAVDDLTVRIRFKRPEAQSLGLAALSQGSWLVPPKYFAEQGFKRFLEKPVGSGPFVLEKRVKDSSTTLRRNPDYKGNSGPAPRLDGLEVRILPEPGARVAALESGDVDLVSDLPVDQVAGLEGRDDVSVVTSPGLRVMELQVDARHGLSDASKKVEVRRALMTAIDRQLVVDQVFQGRAKPANQVAAPGYIGYVDDLPPIPYDPDKTKQLLAEAGYPDGVELPLVCSSGNYPKDKELCSVISAELAKAGIEAPAKTLETGAFLNGVLAGDVGPMILIARLPPTLHVLDMLTSSLCASGDSYRCDEEFDALHERAHAETDEAKQLERMRQLAEYELEDPVRIPLWIPDDNYGLSKRVQDWKPRRDQALVFWGVGVAG